MTPDFPHSIRFIKFAQSFFFILRPEVAISLPCWLSQFTFSNNVRMQQKRTSIEPILFLYYEESLVSSKLNSKQFRFHCVRPNVHAKTKHLQKPNYCLKEWFASNVVKTLSDFFKCYSKMPMKLKILLKE